MKKLATVVVTLLAALVLAPAAFAEATSGPASGVELSAAPEPTAEPAQGEDVSGGNEYSEETPPTGTGDPGDTPDSDTGDTNDTTSQPAPTGGGTTSGSEVAATEATDTGAEEGGLPRTGADSWIIALIGVALLGCGIVVRRAALPQR
jgi:LPXTG-motif cell wall-anchored protein